MVNREVGDPFSPSPFTFPSNITPPFIFRFTWGVGREGGGEKRRGSTRRRLGKTKKCPPSPNYLRGHLKPSSRRSPGGRCKTLPVALQEGSAKRVSPSPRHPWLSCHGRGAQRLSVAQTSPLAPAVPARPSPRAPRPADPFKPPGLSMAAPGNAGQDWGRDDEAPSRAVAGHRVR